VPRLGRLLLGSGVAAVAWFFLVGAAIDFGHTARNGQTTAWAFTAAATLGAAVCLLLVFVLVARLLATVGLVGRYRPRRSAGRRVLAAAEPAYTGPGAAVPATAGPADSSTARPPGARRR
jgi:hypothetical protein